MDKVVADFLEGVLVCDRHDGGALPRGAVADAAQPPVSGDKQGEQQPRGGAEPTTICMTASASGPAPGSIEQGSEALQDNDVTFMPARKACARPAERTWSVHDTINSRAI